MRIPNVLVLLLLTILLSCSSSADRYADNGVGGTGNIAYNGDDESGIGGTGKKVTRSGVGGTGKSVANSGVGGTGKSVANSGVGGTGKSVANSGVGGTGKSVANSGVGGTGKQIASGLGGTGKKRDGMGGTGRSGLGGTGQIANSSGVGGTGIIGEITGFGSIYVNGIEVEILDYSEMRIDNKTDKSVKPNIGDIVEILAHRIGDETHAKILNIRHEVVGPVESVNVQRRSFNIIGQTIKLPTKSPMRLPDLGKMIAVSGLRDQRGIIHATRITESNSKYVWLIDEISNNKFNILRFGNTQIHTEHASYYPEGKVIRVRAAYKNGTLFAEQIYPNQAFGNRVQHMILQGYIRRGNRNNYQIGSTQFSARSARIRAQLAQKRGRWTRIEVRRNSIGLWVVEHLIDNSNLTRGQLTPTQSNNRTQGLYNRNKTQPNLSRGSARRSGSSSKSPNQNPQLPGSNGENGMPQNPMLPDNTNPLMPGIPTMPNYPNPTNRPEMPKSMPNMPSMPGTTPGAPQIPNFSPGSNPSMPGSGMMPERSNPDTLPSRPPSMMPNSDSPRAPTMPNIESNRIPVMPNSGSMGGMGGGSSGQDANDSTNKPPKSSGGMM